MIYKKKTIKDLKGIKDVLFSVDPFLANVMNRAIDCVENQPEAPVVSAMEMIRIRYAAAKGEERAVLGDVLRLLEGECV